MKSRTIVVLSEYKKLKKWEIKMFRFCNKKYSWLLMLLLPISHFFIFAMSAGYHNWWIYAGYMFTFFFTALALVEKYGKLSVDENLCRTCNSELKYLGQDYDMCSSWYYCEHCKKEIEN